MILHPGRLTEQQRQAVDRWLTANGSRHHVSIDEPVVIAGRHAHYTAISRRDRKSMRRIRIRDGWLVPLGRRTVRIRVPLAAYLTRES